MSWTAIWNHDGPRLVTDMAAAKMDAATFLLEGRISRANSPEAPIWAGHGEDGVMLRRTADGAVDLLHRDRHLRSDPGLVQPGEAYRLIYRNAADGVSGLELRSLDRPGVAGFVSSFARSPLLTEDFVPAGPVTEAFGGFAALANHDAPMADGAGLEAGTQVATQAGAVPVEALKPGDVVITGQGQQAIVQETQRHEAVTLGSMNAVRLRAPYFGLQQDVVVSRGTQIVLSGHDVYYTFGTEQVAAEAGDLVNGRAILRDMSVPLRDLVTVQLDRPGALTVGRARIGGTDAALDLPRIDKVAAQSLVALAGDARGLIG